MTFETWRKELEKEAQLRGLELPARSTLLMLHKCRYSVQQAAYAIDGEKWKEKADEDTGMDSGDGGDNSAADTTDGLAGGDP